MDGHDLARRALTHLGAGLPLPEDVRTWMLSGLRDYLAGEELEQALGLAPARGGAYMTAKAVYRLEQRDKTLRAIKFWLCDDLSNWASAAEIEALLVAANRHGEPLGLDNMHPVRHLLSRLAGESLSRRQLLRVLNGDRSG